MGKCTQVLRAAMSVQNEMLTLDGPRASGWVHYGQVILTQSPFYQMEWGATINGQQVAVWTGSVSPPILIQAGEKLLVGPAFGAISNSSLPVALFAPATFIGVTDTLTDVQLNMATIPPLAFTSADRAIYNSPFSQFPATTLLPGYESDSTISIPPMSGPRWMVLVRGGVGGGGTIPLTPGYPGNADAAVQDQIDIVSSSTGKGLGQVVINQQLYFAPGYNNNNGGQAGLFAVFPFISNCEITLKTTWNTTLTNDLPVQSSTLFLVEDIYPYIPVLPSFGVTAISESFTAGETMYMVYGSNMYPYDWITVNVNNPNNTSNLTVEIYLSSYGYGLGTLLLPSTTLGDGQNFFNLRTADGGLTSSIATPQIIVAITSSVAQSVFVTGYAYPDLSKPLLLA